jgi:hypothetical protein
VDSALALLLKEMGEDKPKDTAHPRGRDEFAGGAGGSRGKVHPSNEPIEWLKGFKGLFEYMDPNPTLTLTCGRDEFTGGAGGSRGKVHPSNKPIEWLKGF